MKILIYDIFSSESATSYLIPVFGVRRPQGIQYRSSPPVNLIVDQSCFESLNLDSSYSTYNNNPAATEEKLLGGDGATLQVVLETIANAFLQQNLLICLYSVNLKINID